MKYTSLQKRIGLRSICTYVTLSILLASLFTANGCKKKPNDPPPPDPPPAKAVNIVVNGLYHQAIMGTDSTIAPDTLRIVDANNAVIPNQWIQFEILEGDGTLLADSANTGATGFARLHYTFDGLKGHAVIRALAPLGVDTVDVVLRANTIIPGDGGQGQHVLLTDNLRTVKAINGQPDAVVNSLDSILIADYEQSAGVVVVLYDNDNNGVFYDTSSVRMILMTKEKFWYVGKTKDSIGIGSGIDTIRAIYGTPTNIYTDPAPPPAIVIEYTNPKLRFWCSTADTVAFQLDVEETTNTAPNSKKIVGQVRDYLFRKNSSIK